MFTFLLTDGGAGLIKAPKGSNECIRLSYRTVGKGLWTRAWVRLKQLY